MAMKQIQLIQQPVRETSISWSSLFPHDTTTITGSEMFIKQLTALMFSCITHIRGIFPEYAFEDKTLDDRKVKLLKGHYECKNAYLMTRWLKSAFKALDSQYMQTLILELLTLDDQPLEYYAVDYTYANNEPSCSFRANNRKEK
uniref:HORMA domain-containing protein n=2 Tax=Rhodnius prolixus TaxID=13249 RepID=T1HPU9_RHOPR